MRRSVLPGGTARALAAGLALLLARQGWAGEAAPLQTVQVAGRYDNAVGGSDAASQGSVGAERLRSRAAASGGELLEFVPGMVVTQHSGEGKANQYFLRGYNLDHGTDFATFVDGMPVNMRSHAHGQGYSDLNFLLPELVRRIDYRKGPYFAGDGDFASAGAAHIRLADSLPAGVASLSLGEYGYRRLVLADSFAAGPGTLLYGMEGVANNGPWVTPERMRKRGATLRYSQGGPRQDFSVTAMAYNNRWNASDQIPLGAPPRATACRRRCAGAATAACSNSTCTCCNRAWTCSATSPTSWPTRCAATSSCKASGAAWPA